VNQNKSFRESIKLILFAWCPDCQTWVRVDIAVLDPWMLLFRDASVACFNREVAVRCMNSRKIVFVHKACGAPLVPIIAQPIPVFYPDRIITPADGGGAKFVETSLLLFYRPSLNIFISKDFSPFQEESEFSMKKTKNGMPQKHAPEKLDGGPNETSSRWMELLLSIFSKLMECRPPPEVTTLRLLIVSVVFVLIILILVVAGQAEYLKEVLPNLPLGG
jgi:hypothetical protein